ncbi:GNAT family N-acetyltransferase [Paracraurococcus ruber]|uniref:GNAT family N-acetyltransferase n=1 Tax=Paracraurococcus ruber TaxID=77675 RepID=A0ABS1D3I4_9PROT|nr:GNAT family N-acetyltransferase [Paracraurococcus ruber]MBK1661359.1 GNAT family N-acetyltransferase [Paracraurococcus ruber]TDG25033.1 GNAT family N-acetyltransferase [Paracraurococcus ruber]
MPITDIRPLGAGDLPAVKAVIAATGLFPADLLDAMAAPFLGGTAAGDLWFVAVADGTPCAVAYCAPERMTDGTWNLLLIAVHPDRQGRGVGAWLTAHVERSLAGRGARILLVETSGLPEFARTRAVYQRLGYAEEARIRDFYAAGEDKVVFRRDLRDGTGMVRA